MGRAGLVRATFVAASLVGSAGAGFAAEAKPGQSGIASVYYYSAKMSRTASGQKMNPHGMNAAHRSLPFGTAVKVLNRRNGRSVVVTINDRGPFIRGRVIDVTPAAARALGFSGLAPVSLAVMRKEAAAVP
jgi:rare lipoprotein A